MMEKQEVLLWRIAIYPPSDHPGQQSAGPCNKSGKNINRTSSSIPNIERSRIHLSRINNSCELIKQCYLCLAQFSKLGLPLHMNRLQRAHRQNGLVCKESSSGNRLVRNPRIVRHWNTRKTLFLQMEEGSNVLNRFMVLGSGLRLGCEMGENVGLILF